MVHPLPQLEQLLDTCVTHSQMSLGLHPLEHRLHHLHDLDCPVVVDPDGSLHSPVVVNRDRVHVVSFSDCVCL